ncbi:MAG: hypothetical protein AB7I50_26480 [Vicinamibacterales bacterium]
MIDRGGAFLIRLRSHAFLGRSPFGLQVRHPDVGFVERELHLPALFVFEGTTQGVETFLQPRAVIAFELLPGGLGQLLFFGAGAGLASPCVVFCLFHQPATFVVPYRARLIEGVAQALLGVCGECLLGRRQGGTVGVLGLDERGMGAFDALFGLAHDGVDRAALFLSPGETGAGHGFFEEAIEFGFEGATRVLGEGPLGCARFGGALLEALLGFLNVLRALGFPGSFGLRNRLVDATHGLGRHRPAHVVERLAMLLIRFGRGGLQAGDAIVGIALDVLDRGFELSLAVAVPRYPGAFDGLLHAPVELGFEGQLVLVEPLFFCRGHRLADLLLGFRSHGATSVSHGEALFLRTGVTPDGEELREVTLDILRDFADGDVKRLTDGSFGRHRDVADLKGRLVQLNRHYWCGRRAGSSEPSLKIPVKLRG